jgi:serine O-acetyltransferase
MEGQNLVAESLDPVIGAWLDEMPVERDVPTLYRLWRQSARFLEEGNDEGVSRCSRLMMLLRSSYVPPQTQIGRGANFAYGGISVVLHRRARIGQHVSIGQNVTVGAKDSQDSVRGMQDVAPVIDDCAFIGPGAVVLGPIRIGAFSIIGANAVVTNDVAPGAVVGVPALRHLSQLNADNILKYRSVFTPLRSWTDEEVVSKFSALNN